MSNAQMTVLDAVRFVTQNGERRSEWAEAALYSLICRIVSGRLTDLSETSLREEIESAALDG